METVIGLLLAISPLVLTAALLLVVDRRQRRAESDVARQIVLTDALHARLGALVAPVVRWRAGVWQVDVAVPAEEPWVVDAVLATADEVFGRVAYELRLRRQTQPARSAPALRRARAVRELSWT